MPAKVFCIQLWFHISTQDSVCNSGIRSVSLVGEQKEDKNNSNLAAAVVVGAADRAVAVGVAGVSVVVVGRGTERNSEEKH